MTWIDSSARSMRLPWPQPGNTCSRAPGMSSAMRRIPTPSGPQSSGVRQSSSPQRSRVGDEMRPSSAVTSVSIMASHASQKTSGSTLRATTSLIACSSAAPKLSSRYCRDSALVQSSIASSSESVP